MSYKSVVFSPTGGTARVAEIMMQKLDPGAEKLDLADPDAAYGNWQFGPEDLVLVAVPSFSGRVPAAAAERLAQLQGNGARCVLVCVYGNRAYEDTLAEMEDLLSGAGFDIIAAAAAVAEHSIVREIAAGRPDAQDREELEGFAASVKEQAGKDGGRQDKIPGSRPYRKAGPAPVPKAGRKCTDCGLCAEECPVGAIPRSAPGKTDASVCIGCMRCTAVCPQQARKINGALMGAVRLMLKKNAAGRAKNELYL